MNRFRILKMLQDLSLGKTCMGLLSCFMIILCACSTDGDIQKILGTKAEAPVFLECRPVSSTEVLFKFSKPVNLVSVNFDPGMDVLGFENGSELRIKLSIAPESGQKITADILVEDSDRNSLNVIVPFRARNDRIPILVFNEIRTEYSKPKVEYVEFLAFESGNLGALRLFIAGYSLSKPAYEFPPAEVKAGQYIVLHLRSLEEGCVDETEANLSASTAAEAQADARDLWVPGTAKIIHKTDALWLVDQDDRIMDAVLLSETSGDAWKTKDSAVLTAAEFLAGKKAWLSSSGETPERWIPGPSDAVITGGTTNTRTICRDEAIRPVRRAANWYITASSSATPGKPNNIKRYVPN